tara:strand:+ start:141 stop:437 length:297 start_codon:yes stop_codon:yes gene_type:complete
LLPNATKGAQVKKQELKDKVTEYGDAVITYRSENSNKLKYNVCTLDFSTPYIQGKKNRAKETDSNLLFFCWDTDSYRLLKPESVTTVVPLSAVLKNEK